MIAFVDIGNTRLKWGLSEAGRWRARGSLSRADPASWRPVIDRWPLVEAVWAVSVAGPAAETELSAALAAHPVPLHWFRAGLVEQCGIRNGYTRPEQLGADRWAALIGAWRCVQEAALVVVAGTATTVDVLQSVDGSGYFAGGVIAPGLTMMRRALAGGTAQLPEADGDFAALPRSTDAAIVTGCLEAQAGLIERMRRRLPAGAPVILSGGAASALVPHVAAPYQAIDDLVLEGLRAVALY